MATSERQLLHDDVGRRREVVPPGAGTVAASVIPTTSGTAAALGPDGTESGYLLNATLFIEGFIYRGRHDAATLSMRLAR